MQTYAKIIGVNYLFTNGDGIVFDSSFKTKVLQMYCIVVFLAYSKDGIGGMGNN